MAAAVEWAAWAVVWTSDRARDPFHDNAPQQFPSPACGRGQGEGNLTRRSTKSPAAMRGFFYARGGGSRRDAASTGTMVSAFIQD